MEQFPPRQEFNVSDLKELNLTLANNGFKVLREDAVAKLDEKKAAKNSCVRLTTKIGAAVKEVFVFKESKNKLVLTEEKPEGYTEPSVG